MTKEQAIENLKDILSEATSNENSVCYVTGEDKETLDMAIKALEQQTNDCKIFGTKENCFGGATENECEHCDYKIQKLEQPTSNDYEYNRGYRDGYDKGNLNGYELRKAEEKKSDDCVSRAEVIKVLDNHWLSGSCSRRIIDEQIDKVKALPPVTPIIPKGATNGDMLTALFGEKALITLDTHNYLKKWWTAPYKRGDEE